MPPPPVPQSSLPLTISGSITPVEVVGLIPGVDVVLVVVCVLESAHGSVEAKTILLPQPGTNHPAPSAKLEAVALYSITAGLKGL